MALFGKKEGKEKPAPPEKAAGARTSTFGAAAPFEVVQMPRITEKSSKVGSGRTYVFNVSPRATKREIRHAIELFYKVTPLSVRTARIPAKTVFVRGKRGRKPGGKKAYLTLPAGQKIDLA